MLREKDLKTEIER